MLMHKVLKVQRVVQKFRIVEAMFSQPSTELLPMHETRASTHKKAAPNPNTTKELHKAEYLPSKALRLDLFTLG